MDLNQIRERVGQDWGRVEALLNGALQSDIDILNSVNERALSNSGKQLRPLLSLLAARACSGGHPTEASFAFAAASELLHNATLFHDDVADSSDERRGVPTLRATMGPTVAVLVGDFWLVRATQLIVGGEFGRMGDRVVKLFTKTLCDLVEGEMLQLQKSQSGDTSEEDYMRIIYGKTGSLFETSILAAAFSVEADKDTEEAMARYARALGYAFQIGDDILDYKSSAEETGKPVGSDVDEGKITLPLFGAFRNAPEREAEIRAAIALASPLPEMRGEIIAYVRSNGGIEYAQERLRTYIEDAISALNVLSPSEDRESLEAIARYIYDRKS